MDTFYARAAARKIPGVLPYDAAIIARLLRDEAHRANMSFYAEGGWNNLDGWGEWCKELREDGLTNVAYSVRLNMLADTFEVRSELADELDVDAID